MLHDSAMYKFTTDIGIDIRERPYGSTRIGLYIL